VLKVARGGADRLRRRPQKLWAKNLCGFRTCSH